MVPEGWKSTTLGHHVKIHSGYAPAALEIGEGGNVPYVKVDDMNNCSRIQLMSKTHAHHEGRVLPVNTVIFPKRGAAIMNNKVRVTGTEIILDTNMMGLEAKDTLNPWFAYYRLIFEKLFKIADTSTIPQINNKHIIPYRFPLPPLPEQRMIAEILSTWDRAIETAQALLATARTQKRALMQSLLTGKRRFPQFEGQAWKEVRLGDVLKEVKRPVDWSDDDLYRLISVRRRSGGLFHRENLHGRDIMTKTLKHARSGDFLISKMQVVHGGMGLVRDEFDGMQISGSYIAVNSKSPKILNIEFFDWLSRMPEMYHRVYLCSYGVHIEKMTFNFSLFLKEKIVVPPSVDEQKRIVDALACAEAEETQLGNQIEYLRTEKKALMQQLLTGKRRVVVDA